MRITKTTAVSLIALTALSACASHPVGPSVAVMPAPNKPFSVFEEDQAVCKNFADQQVAGAAQGANNSALGAAAIGTVLGAGLGAAIGGGRGAAIGAASGAGAGTLYGTSQSNAANMTIQQRYDIAYQQCMYSRGNQVPGYQQAPSPVSQPPGYAPPPPPPPPPR
ncbi:MAG TPA: YMGG-like glycine zipper-containing protein [Stellaceae bacterium]|nr:YMGG-like glycine zipper-containing protein [Stellaceae bacterium]